MYAGGRGDPTARRYSRAWSWLIARGLGPRRWATLEVRGRRSGELRSFPLGLADVAGRWYRRVDARRVRLDPQRAVPPAAEVVLHGRGWAPAARARTAAGRHAAGTRCSDPVRRDGLLLVGLAFFVVGAFVA